MQMYIHGFVFLEEVIFSHKHILAKTRFFQQQIISSQPFLSSQLFIDLTMIPDALNNFRSLLMLLYTGNINTVMTSNNETVSTSGLPQRNDGIFVFSF